MLDEINYLDKTFERLDLSSKIIENKIFENCCFKRCNFDQAILLNCKFIDCEFTHCSLNNIKPTNTLFSKVAFHASKLMGIHWPHAKWPQIKLFSPIHFYECNISHSSFFGLNLSEINMQSCKANDIDFREADLSNGSFVDTDFYQSLFVQTNLSSADFSGAVNYNIDMNLNHLKKAIFSFPDVINLLQNFEIKINGLPEAVSIIEAKRIC
jgi:fluoroquinolone resistance protein